VLALRVCAGAARGAEEREPREERYAARWLVYYLREIVFWWRTGIITKSIGEAEG